MTGGWPMSRCGQASGRRRARRSSSLRNPRAGLGALPPELFPANVRYTGSGISYNVSSILGAAIAPFIAVALWSAGGGSPFLVGIYLSTMAILTLLALLIGRETKDVDIDA